MRRGVQFVHSPEVEEKKGNGARKWWWVLGALVLLLPVAYLGLHRLRDPQPSPWSESDLPVAPDPEDNGWALLPIPVSACIEFEDDTVWASVQSGWPETCLNVAEPALSRPRFVEACRPGGECHPIPTLQLFRASRGGMAWLARNGRWTEAADRWTRDLTHLVDLNENARSLVMHMVALMLLEQHLRFAEDLVLRVPAMERSAFAARLRVDVSRERLESWDLSAGIIADYLFMRGELEREGGLLFDRAQTIDILTEEARAHVAYARGRGAAPAARVWTDEGGWWLYNAQGKQGLDVIAMAPVQAHTFELKRAAAVSALRALELRLEAEPAPTPEGSETP